MIVFSEYSPALDRSRSAQHLAAATQAATLQGLKVYHIPQDFGECGDADGALAHVPIQPQKTSAVWIGYIPSPERYTAVYEAAAGRNIRLVNSPEEHLRAQEFDRAYPLLKGITPDSVIIEDIEDCDATLAELGLPVFVKGVVQSLKGEGWAACVASTAGELRAIVARLLKLEDRTRGRVVARKLVKLRHVQQSGLGIPVGREFRVFLCRQNVLGFGHYWEGSDPLEHLDKAEENEVLELAREAAVRLATPFVAIDVGQLETGKWTVIEPGDAQFAGYCKIPVLRLWEQITAQSEERSDA